MARFFCVAPEAEKTYTSLREVGSLDFTDKAGNPVSWHEFKKQADELNIKYNEHYLNTEYQFAAMSAENVSKWEQLDEDSILQYRTALDDKVRDSHVEMEGITLPASDKFWDENYPPNGWNCRCVAVEVRAGKYPMSDSADAFDKGRKSSTQIGKDGKNKAALFRFNPGKQKKIFPDGHPYTSGNCGELKATWTRLAAKIGTKAASAYLAKEGDKCKAKKVVEEQATKQNIDYKRAIYEKPIDEQYKSVFENKKTSAIIEAHELVNKKQGDYKEVMYGAKAWTQEGKSARMQPTIHKSEIEARKKIFPNYNNPNSNPDLLLNDGRYIDIKSPENTGNIVHLANKANRQGAEACITDYKYKFDEEFIKINADRIFNNKDKGKFTYNMDRVHFVIKGKIHTFDNSRKI